MQRPGSRCSVSTGLCTAGGQVLWSNDSSSGYIIILKPSLSHPLPCCVASEGGRKWGWGRGRVQAEGEIDGGTEEGRVACDDIIVSAVYVPYYLSSPLILVPSDPPAPYLDLSRGFQLRFPCFSCKDIGGLPRIPTLPPTHPSSPLNLSHYLKLNLKRGQTSR